MHDLETLLLAPVSSGTLYLSFSLFPVQGLAVV